METIYKVISIMRKNKKNWEIFSKGVKNIAIVCNHIPTTPALINNRENNMKNNFVPIEEIRNNTNHHLKVAKQNNGNFTVVKKFYGDDDKTVEQVNLIINKNGNVLSFKNVALASSWIEKQVQKTFNNNKVAQ